MSDDVIDVGRAGLPDRFQTFPDRGIVDGRLVALEPDKSNVVEVPQCGFWTVVWRARHADRGYEQGTMLVARTHNESYAHNIVAEVLWARGYVGDYTVIPVR